VTLPTGCYSSDSLLVQVHSQPEIFPQALSGFACAPNSINVTDLIDPFSTSPTGTDTLYFADASCTIPYAGNPLAISSADTLYIVFATNTTPVCADTVQAIIDISQGGSLIVNQDPVLNYSIPLSPPLCNSLSLTDGVHDTVNNFQDCSRVASILDIPNGTSLGNVTVCEEIYGSIPTHNGQPYLNRIYEITSSTNESMEVCLYYLDSDFELYNSEAIVMGWPLLPTQATPQYIGNLAITQTTNGDLNSGTQVPTVIPNSALNITFDATYDIWNVCFPTKWFFILLCPCTKSI
jgi:hypothetical protein